MIELNIDQADYIQDIITRFPEQAKIATYRAINRTTTATKTEISRQVRAKYNVKHKDVLNTLRVDNAHTNSLKATITSKGELIPLSSFSARQLKSGVSVAVLKGKRSKINGLFLTTLKQPKYEKGATNVFSRKTAKRAPLRGHYGPSIPQMVGNEQPLGKVESRGQEVLLTRLEHELNRLLRG